MGLAPLAYALEGMEMVRPPPRPVQVTDIVPVAETGTAVEVSEAIETDPGDDAETAENPITLVLVSRIPPPRPDDLLKGFEFRFAVNAAARGDWEEAKRLATQHSPVAAAIIEWQRLRGGRGTFEEYRAFLARHGDFPGLKLLRKRGEPSILPVTDASDVIAYFNAEPPQTGHGALMLVDAFAAQGNFTRSRQELIKIWRTMELTAAEEAQFLAKYDEVLAPYHVDRLDDALWRKDRDGARRMLDHADDDLVALSVARLALQARSNNADRLWQAVPEHLAQDPGLALDRMEWLVATKKRDDAATLIIERSTSANALGRPEAWSRWRRILARQEMREGNSARAYQLASQSHLSDGFDYADLEWVAGYVALRYHDDPAKALTHFRRFRDQVFTPVSLGRAGYWEGRALEAMGETNGAEAAYRDAAQHQTTFYGLLAAERMGIPMDLAVTGRQEPTNWQELAFAQTDVFQAANLWHSINRQWEVTRYLRHLSETTAKDELEALGSFTSSLGNPYIAVRVGKRIAQDGAIAHSAYYPLTDLGQENLPVAEELALAIARRESEFYVAAKSGVGARGLMQLMPGTAKQMAAKLDMPYELARLTRDPVYNATLGSAYLKHLEEEFGNNIVLISVGYNAGPARARGWMQDRGDPRSKSIDVIDWIEHIPFNETRNYVMRVAESLPVYRARLTGKVQPIRLLEELQAR